MGGVKVASSVISLAALLWLIVFFQMKDLNYLLSLSSRGEKTAVSVNNIDNDKAGAWERMKNEETQQAAFEFVMSRKKAYEAHGFLHWGMRGMGYLYLEHDMILAAIPPSNPQEGKQHVAIVNVHPSGRALPKNECHLWTIWVRVMGPEIFAGSAEAVVGERNNSCCWTFEFDLKVPGTYFIDSKVLLYNAKDGKFTPEMVCNSTEGEMPIEIKNHFKKRASFQGFKLYNPELSCCELCSRQQHCQYWSTPPSRLENPAKHTNGCEFYYDDKVPDQAIPKSYLLGDIAVNYSLPKKRPQEKVKHVYGTSHRQPTSQFVGCGWSNMFTLDFPCLDGSKDDNIFVTQDSFTLVSSEDLTKIEPQDNLPLCSSQQESLAVSHGRWVIEPWPSPELCPDPMRPNEKFSKRFDIMEFDPERPQCWHRDDLQRIGQRCIEMNCELIHRESKMKTRLKATERWFGVFRQHTCDYLEFTAQQLQQCINRRKLASFQTKGASIANFLGEYLKVRLDRLHLYNASNDGISVILGTESLTHRCKKPGLPDFTTMAPVRNNTKFFVMNGFYVSSEREVHIHMERLLRMSQAAERRLVPKGYKILNAFDMSAAMTYDTATQMDGLHIIGPTMKMVITKMFHYLCKDVVKGSRVGSAESKS